MKYLIYGIIAALIIWSVYYLGRRLYRLFHDIRQCDGCCDGCSFDCSNRNKKKKRDL